MRRRRSPCQQREWEEEYVNVWLPVSAFHVVSAASARETPKYAGLTSAYSAGDGGAVWAERCRPGRWATTRAG